MNIISFIQTEALEMPVCRTFIQTGKLWIAFTTILQKKHNYITK